MSRRAASETSKRAVPRASETSPNEPSLARGAVIFEADFSIPAGETKLAVCGVAQIEIGLARQATSD